MWIGRPFGGQGPRLRRGLRNSILGALLSIAIPGIWPARAQTEGPVETYRIAVQATAGATRAIETWRATEDVLNQASAAQGLPYRFIVLPETGGGLIDAIEAGRADLLLTDPAAFVVAEVNHDARAILSTARILDGRSVDQTGALVFARADVAIGGLEDLAGRNVMAVASTDFSGWWLAAQEFRRFRLEPMDHLGEVMFSGGNEREVVYAVQSGLVDAGVIRAGALEELAAAGAISMDAFQPVSLQRHEGFPYWVSTPLYPERVLSALPNVPDAALSLVINTLLELEIDTAAATAAGQLAWQAPENYQSVHALLVSLRAPPYENYIWQAVVRIHRLYRWPIYGVVLAILGSLAFLTYQARRNMALAEARRAVLKSESRSKVFYRNAIENHTVFCMLTRDGKISHVNDRFCELAGQDRRRLLGQELSTFLSERDQAVLSGEIAQSMDLKTPWNGHLRLRKQAGSYSWAQCTVIPVTGIEDQLSEIALVATDMTSTQQDVVEETFNDTLELIEDPVIVLRPRGLDILYCNKAAHQALVSERVGGDWKDRPITDFITAEDVASLRMRAEAVVDGPMRRVTWEVESGKGVDYEISLEYVIPDMDEPSLVVMYRDVTERKAAERAKNEFISTVSHELRTPLTSMRGALQMVSSGVMGEVPGKMQELIDMAGRNTDRLMTLINDILDLEKIEAEKMEYHLEPLDLVELIEQATEANRFYAQRFNVTLVPRIDMAEAPYVTMGDWNRLMQVMDNLLSNAAKFSHEGGEVHINLYRHKDWIRMSVRDYGTGIPEGSQSKIFGRFVQSDSSDTRAKGGTGLGLAIVRPIVASHNGAISFHSEENVGTEFYVDLPRFDGEHASAVEKSDSLIVARFSEVFADTDAEIPLPQSALVRALEERLQATGWTTELEPGRVTLAKILSGSGLLGHTIALDLVDAQCRGLISDLMAQDVIEGAPVHILEAALRSDDGAPTEDGDRRGSLVVSHWLRELPDLIGQGEPVKIMVMGAQDGTLIKGERMEVTRVADAQQAAALARDDGFDLVLALWETGEACTALILPTRESRLLDEVPMTIFAGQKAAKGPSMGVVSKFNRRGGASRGGRAR